MLYTRKLDYAADDETGAYVALIAIAKEKGGEPVKFIVYRFRSSIGPKGMFDMIEFPGSQESAARKAFPYGNAGYIPLDEEMEWKREGVEKGWCPRTRINAWKETTDWLWDISVGGSYKVHPDGEWVKIEE